MSMSDIGILEMLDHYRALQDVPKDMQDIMRHNGLKIDNLEDPMQKLAFTFYCELVQIAEAARKFFEDEGSSGDGET
jgi:hypothetical protein